MRIIVKGNYTAGNAEYLNWVAAYINTPWVYGSYWEHQTKRFVGSDCADLVISAYEFWGGTIPQAVIQADPEFNINGPSAKKLWGWSEDYPELFEEIVAPTTTFEIDEDDLQPGDIIILGQEHAAYYKSFKARHAVIFVSADGSGKLSQHDQLLHANCEHPGGEFYRVGPGEFRFKQFETRYPKAIVLRLHKEE